MKIYILSSGLHGCSNDLPEAAFKTHKAMLKYIKENYPDAKGTSRVEPNEHYWEDDSMWLWADKIELL
jgi:hypothetical protein